MCCFENFRKFSRNVFSRVTFEQYGLSNLPPVTILKNDSIKNPIRCIDLFQKAALFILTGAASLQSADCNTTRNRPLTKFVRGILEIS